MEEAVSAFLADIREAARIPLCSQGLRSPHRELRAEVTAPGARLLLIWAAEVTTTLWQEPRSQPVSVSLSS